MKKLIILLILFTLTACENSNEDADNQNTGLKASLEDFSPLNNKDCTGTLSYLDYGGKDKRYTIPALAKISLKSPNTIRYAIEYPKEPRMNSKEKIRLSDGGQKIDGNVIINRELKPDGSLSLSTEESGKDNNQAATIRTTYTISDAKFTIRKDFKLVDATEYVNRNEFVFSAETND